MPATVPNPEIAKPRRRAVPLFRLATVLLVMAGFGLLIWQPDRRTQQLMQAGNRVEISLPMSVPEALESLKKSGATVNDSSFGPAVTITRVNAETLAALLTLPRVHAVSLDGRLPEGVIADIVAKPGLQILFLQHTRITLNDLRTIAASGTIQYLDLSHTNLSNAGLAVVAKMRQLTSLRIADTRVTDAGVEFLLGHPALVELMLYDTAVTDDSLSTLIKMRGLEFLVVTGTRMTRKAVGAFRKERPDCHVIFED